MGGKVKKNILDLNNGRKENLTGMYGDDFLNNW